MLKCDLKSSLYLVLRDSYAALRPSARSGEGGRGPQQPVFRNGGEVHLHHSGILFLCSRRQHSDVE